MQSALIDPNQPFPVMLPNGDAWPHTIFLKHYIDHPNIQIGDFTYYNDFNLPYDNVRQKLIPYMHPACPERLSIGKFTQIAHGVQIITSSANHQMDGFSTYPFAVFGQNMNSVYTPRFPNKGDTYIGHDVWLGHQSIIMPAVTIGSGSIIASGTVVTKDVPAYHIVGGNPAKIIRPRFDKHTIEQLVKIAWWDWEFDKIKSNLPAITGADINALLRA